MNNARTKRANGFYARGNNWMLLLGLFLSRGEWVTAQHASGEVIGSAKEIRRLSPEQADHHLQVRLRAVVTFYDEALYSRFIQDQTAGIYLREMTNMPPLKPGQIVEVEGETSAGEYAPIVIPKAMKVVGEGTMPEAKPVSLEELVSGREDSQFVELVGMVRSVHYEEEFQNYLIDIVLGGERFTAWARKLPVPNGQDLVESLLRVRGVCSSQFNRQRQLFGFRLLVPRETDLRIEHPASADPFDVPTQGISSLLQFTVQSTFGRRVKVGGSVVYQEFGAALFIQDEEEGLYCQTRQRLPLKPGDRVEVLGFPAKGEYTPMLQDAVYRKVRAGAPPAPALIDLDEALSGTHDCRLVQIRAKLLERAQRGREQFLALETAGFVFHAYLGQEAGGALAPLQNGSEVLVTGVCLIERGSGWRAGEAWRAKSFRLLLRSPQDVRVLRTPTWWTLGKVLWVAGGLGVVAFAAVMWVVVLRRRVLKQTRMIRERLQMEASLKARYESLFENANDMVFTHDLNGRITSINETGERLLRRSRQSIISRNLTDLLAEDQRSAARQWMAEVVKGVEVPTVEWDFLDTEGHRLKLEISSRIVEQGGRVVEVEGIARDITERRRLEREILEITNREQRRIGHDLHDGICQQLAAITYLVDILGDRLQETGVPEAGEAERIGHLINEANAQARSVARGLFPARLEEHGLVLALEDLTASASARYRITCRFVCGTALAKLDPEMELHLYYIVQEALLNAVNHGNATRVIVTMGADDDRLRLTIQDNGSGFDLTGKNRSGMGIRIMKYRAKVIGATLDLHTQAGQGTQVTCTFTAVPGASPPKTTNDRSGR